MWGRVLSITSAKDSTYYNIITKNQLAFLLAISLLAAPAGLRPAIFDSCSDSIESCSLREQ
jgi:hypothetical protein